MLSFPYLLACRLMALLTWRARGDAAKELEILVLRHQVAVLRRQVKRVEYRPVDRALLALLSRALPRSAWRSFLVTPETLLRWHRAMVTQCRCLCAAKQFMVSLWWCSRWNRHASMGGFVQ
jgi:hypothetical protein